ncbi:MAG: alpha/beta hydrolase [Lachnospiraceae bacterium]|nr:alpha/beta hydrolase [Lachnospiraceae bacterium]
MRYEHFDIELNFRDGCDPDFVPSVNYYILDTIDTMTMIKKRPMVIVCAGGAYGYKSAREAEPVATQFLGAGFHAAVLDYSVAPAKWPCSARELAHAVAIARKHAEEWKVLEDGIFVCGFSAGGHLACTLSTMWDDPAFYKEFESLGIPAGETAPWRPDGAVLGYPVVTMLEFTHEGSRDNVCGKDAPKELLEALSLERRVSSKTVPTFLFHTAEDGAVPCENSINYVLALRKHGIPCEFHLFEKGGHGLSLCNELSSVYEGQILPADEVWIKLAITWVKGRISPAANV